MTVGPHRHPGRCRAGRRHHPAAGHAHCAAAARASTRRSVRAGRSGLRVLPIRRVPTRRAVADLSGRARDGAAAGDAGWLAGAGRAANPRHGRRSQRARAGADIGRDLDPAPRRGPRPASHCWLASASPPTPSSTRKPSIRHPRQATLARCYFSRVSSWPPGSDAHRHDYGWRYDRALLLPSARSPPTCWCSWRSSARAPGASPRCERHLSWSASCSRARRSGGASGWEPPWSWQARS